MATQKKLTPVRAENRPLTAKQQRFVDEYLVDLCATRAAVRAGYSPKTAKEIGYENLTKPHIAVAIEQAKEKRSEETGISAAQVVRRLAAIGFADPGDYLTAEQKKSLKHIMALNPGQRAAIQEIQIIPQNGGDAVKLKLRDPVPALKLIGDHLNMWNGGEDTGQGQALLEETLSYEAILSQIGDVIRARVQHRRPV